MKLPVNLPGMEGNSTENPPSNPPGNPPRDPNTYTQQFEHQPVAARVPERLSKGVLSTGVLVLDSPSEFMLDFMQALSRPYQFVARVVIAPMIMEQLVGAVSENWSSYTRQFGTPSSPPQPPPQHRPTLAEIYENFKFPDEMLSGAYANSLMIGHTAHEFVFDFITGFYPHAAVSSRIMMAAPQVPKMLDTLRLAVEQYRKRYMTPPPPPSGEAPK
ncbi:MAG: DUF3467 domain-containing protein [Tepidisphaeraceae bacterium]|jgi:hypothetical protein